MFRCVVIPTLIKAVALTYIVIDIYIIIICINIPSKYIFFETIETKETIAKSVSEVVYYQ